ncbi:MAG TPA: glycosyltransferase family 4 protein, partial [Casimicrobiaceae bacterium]|nr:glycosyltransferase family 4 protein [Casimicrobiaceae bacterium]
MRVAIGFFLGTHEDWGGASRALLNFIRKIDRTRFRPIVLVTKRGPLVERLESEGIEWLAWPTHDRGPNFVRYAAEIWRAARFFRAHALQILHINHGTIGWKPAEVLAARILRIPIINHLHVAFEQPSSFIRYSSIVVAVSQYVADRSESLGAPKRVIHNISDLERFSVGVSLRRELGYADSDVIVAFLGQMIRVKGLEMFIDVATRIADPRAKFVVAGPMRNTQGAYTEDEVRELVARDPRIRYLGFRTDVENLYATSDVIVMPSQWEEPCAMV